MSDNCNSILSGYCGSLCRDSVGGINELYITMQSNISNVSEYPDGTIEDIVLDFNKKWYYLEMLPESSFWSETVVSEETNNVEYFERSVDVVIGATCQATRNILEEVSTLPLAIIVQDGNGRYWLFENIRLNGGQNTSGINWTDRNALEMQFLSKSKVNVPEIDVMDSETLKEDLDNAKHPDIQPPDHYILYNSSTMAVGDWVDTNTDTRFNTYNALTGEGVLYVLDGVTTIGGFTSTEYSPFYDDAGLTSVDLSNTEFTTLGTYTFYGCTNLEDVVLPDNITAIQSYCFYGCESLIDFDIPTTISELDRSVFEGSGITSVEVPVNITTIGNSSYKDCTSLQELYIALNGCYNISNYAFSGCMNLTDVSLGSVQTIGIEAFADCSTMESITIPASVAMIGQGAFSGCNSLTSVTSLSETPPVLAQGNFNPVNDILYVPYSGYQAYVDSSWNSVFSQVRPINYSYITVNAGANGSASGEGWYENNTTATLTATADEHYHFTAWNDSNTDNPRSVNVGTTDSSYGCSFAIDRFLLNVGVNDSSYGSATGTGMYDYGTQVQISAIPNENYYFASWQDGNTDNPRTITITGSATYVATFELGQFTINVGVNDSDYGSASGSGTYSYGTQVQISAIPNEHYHFTAWNDGNTQNPRTITVTENASYTATLAVDRFVISVGVNDSSYGSATGTGVYGYGTQVEIEAIPNNHYHFTAWNDGNTQNPRTITVTGNTSYVATLAVDTFTLSVTANDASYGSTTGSGTYDYGTSVQISATPNVGYLFMQWNDGIVNNPRTISVTTDASYVATFAVRAVNPVPYIGDVAVSGRWLDDNTNTNSNSYNASTNEGVIYVYDSVTTIGGSRSTDDSPFYGSSVTEVDLRGTSITDIDDYAFADSSLTDLYIDSSVPPTLGTDVFDSSVTVHVPFDLVDEYETAWGSEVNVVSDDNVILYTSGNQASGNWVANNTDTTKNTYNASTGEGVLYLNSGVTTLGGGESTDYSPFYQDASLTAVNIDYSDITNVGNYAFTNCSSLASFSIPNRITTIGSYAFYNCTSLTSITIPNNVTTLGGNAFNGCTSLTSATIGTGVTALYDYAFSGTGLTSVTIPNNVTTLGTNVFNGCSNLASATIGTGVTTIDEYTFYNCTSLTSISIPSNVTSIGLSAFTGCSSLATATLNSGLTTIGNYAFSDCTSLTSVTIPNSVTTLGTNAFIGCTSLTTATIGTGVTTIGEFTFANCTSLTNLTIGSNVTVIDDSAFQHSGLTSVTLPANVTKIEDYAFDCSVLTSVTCEALSVPTLGAVNFTASNDTLYVHASVLSAYQADSSWNSAFTTIAPIEKVILYTSGNQASGNWVANNTDTTKNIYNASTGEGVLFLNSGVTTIGGGSSTDYSPFYLDASLTAVNINYSGFTGVLGAAFRSTALEYVEIPEGVTKTGGSILHDCGNLKELHLPSTLAQWGGNCVTNCSKLEKVYCSATGSISTDATLGTNIGRATLFVPESAFDTYCSNTWINSTFLYIGVITDTNTIIYKSNQASGGWVTNNTDTTKNKYHSSSKRGVLYVNSGVTTIGGAISEMTPSEQKNYTPFYADTALTALNLDYSGLTIYEVRAFYGCSALTIVNVPEGVTSITGAVFRECPSLATVYLPTTITGIGGSAFYGDTALNNVYCYKTTPPTLSANNFSKSGDTLHVPSASLNAYKTATNWSTAFTTYVGF